MQHRKRDQRQQRQRGVETGVEEGALRVREPAFVIAQGLVRRSADQQRSQSSPSRSAHRRTESRCQGRDHRGIAEQISQILGVHDDFGVPTQSEANIAQAQGPRPRPFLWSFAVSCASLSQRCGLTSSRIHALFAGRDSWGVRRMQSVQASVVQHPAGLSALPRQVLLELQGHLRSDRRALSRSAARPDHAGRAASSPTGTCG